MLGQNTWLLVLCHLLPVWPVPCPSLRVPLCKMGMATPAQQAFLGLGLGQSHANVHLPCYYNAVPPAARGVSPRPWPSTVHLLCFTLAASQNSAAPKHHS